jgi:hypothetical protein
VRIERVIRQVHLQCSREPGGSRECLGEHTKGTDAANQVAVAESCASIRNNTATGTVWVFRASKQWVRASIGFEAQPAH